MHNKQITTPQESERLKETIRIEIAQKPHNSKRGKIRIKPKQEAKKQPKPIKNGKTIYPKDANKIPLEAQAVKNKRAINTNNKASYGKNGNESNWARKRS